VSARVAFLMRHSPYGTVYPAEGFRAIMGTAVFEMNIVVVFVDDGVYVALKAQRPDGIDMKPLGDGLPGLSDVGVKEFYVHDASLAERGLSAADLTVDAVVADAAHIAEVLAGCSAVLPF
jgi:tRNA 2-thiouridine synthesizing protein C